MAKTMPALTDLICDLLHVDTVRDAKALSEKHGLTEAAVQAYIDKTPVRIGRARKRERAR